MAVKIRIHDRLRGPQNVRSFWGSFFFLFYQNQTMGILNDRLLVVATLIFVATVNCYSQTETASKNDDKAEQIVQKAVQAVGGEAYLKLQSVIGRGFFTEYHQGVPGIPVRFLDYIIYPYRERTEFSGGGNRIVQTNEHDQGWIFDAAAKTIKDQTAQQVADFKTGVRTSLENLLHGWWRKEGATLSYAGRREATLGRRNETVRLTYPDGFWIEYEFAAIEGTPAKVIYKRKQKNLDTDQMEETTEEDYVHKPVSIAGVTSPLVIDHFRNRVQTSRINYESIEYNKSVPDSLFTKPANIKAIK